jgi:hypothetical protein
MTSNVPRTVVKAWAASYDVIVPVIKQLTQLAAYIQKQKTERFKSIQAAKKVQQAA